MSRSLPLLALLLSACVAGGDTGGKSDCSSTVDPSDAYYDRFEGTSADNACTTDADCVVGGCSAEVCAAESVDSTCEGLPSSPEGTCGCLDGACVWQSCE